MRHDDEKQEVGVNASMKASVKTSVKEATPDTIREVIEDHFKVHPTLKAASLTYGRNWLSGHMDEIDDVLMQMVNSKKLRRFHMGRQVVYIQRDFEVLVATYWQQHGVIDEKALVEMSADFVMHVEGPSERIRAAAATRTQRMYGVVQRIANNAKRYEESEQLLKAIRGLEDALGCAGATMLELGVMSIKGEPKSPSDEAQQHGGTDDTPLP